MLARKLFIGVVGMLSLGAVVRADTVVAKDGRTFVGQVTVKGDTFTIKTRFGTFDIPADQIGEWKKDTNPTTPEQGQNPGDPKATVPRADQPMRPAGAVDSSNKHGESPAPSDRTPAQKQAEDELNAGRFKSAIDLLSPLVKDSKNQRLYHALGLAYFKNHQEIQSVVYFERAMKLSDSPDRALVINTAAAQVAARYYSKAIKVLSDYLTKHGNDVDEDVLNALGRALAASDDATRSTKTFADGAQTYQTSNSALEATRPGFKRFGENWFPADEADIKLRTLSDNANNVNQARQQVKDADQNLANAKSYQTQAYSVGGYRLNRGAADRGVQDAAQNFQNAQARLNSAMQQAQSPFPTVLETVSINSVKPGTHGDAPADAPDAPVQVAMKTRDVQVLPRGVAPADPGNDSATDTQPALKPQTSPTLVPEAPDKPVPRPEPKPVEPVEEPISNAAAFPVSDQLLVTSAAAVKGAKDVSVEGRDGISIKAKIERIDEASGLALIRVETGHYSFLGLADKYAGGKFDCAGFDTVDLFNPAATLIPGSAPVPGAHWILTFEHRPKLAGSPLIANGQVVGVELGGDDNEPNKATGVTLETLKKFVARDLPNAPANNPDPAAAVLKVNVDHG